MLKAKFERGELNGTEDPKIVWQSEPAFREYKLDTFRTRYNRTRSEMVGNGKRAAHLHVETSKKTLQIDHLTH